MRPQISNATQRGHVQVLARTEVLFAQPNGSILISSKTHIPMVSLGRLSAITSRGRTGKNVVGSWELVPSNYRRHQPSSDRQIKLNMLVEI